MRETGGLTNFLDNMCLATQNLVGEKNQFAAKITKPPPASMCWLQFGLNLTISNRKQVHREHIEGSLGVFWRQTRGRIRGLGSGRGCSRGFARRKSRGEPSIYSRGSPKGTQGTSRGTPFTTISPRLFHKLSFFLDPKQIKSNKQTNNIKNTANVALGSPLESLFTNCAPRVCRGEYTWQQTVPLTQLNLSMQVGGWID